MYDEPHRWLQAVENRILYVEKRLRGANPVVGLPYADGAVLFTVRPHGQQKVYEVYDRLALGGLGHPADVERLRMMAINLAHTEGFTRSAADVTLQRLLNFAIAPQVKSAFDEVFRSPVIAKFLMVELAHVGDDTRFFTLNFDGNFSSRDTFGIAAGTHQ
ncbi:20S proteasome subunit A/B, partial [Candidatus Poribacteria bacterium]|nr:20S proteasome subunit A/B [Candidatus Poribacteria bacterium]